MLISSLTLLAVSLSPGNVITIPREVPVVVAGLFNWALRERPLLLGPRTKVIVTRLAPEGLTGVVEVRVFDGTNRLGWLEDAGLAPIRPAVADRAGPAPTPARGRSAAARSDARSNDFRTFRRKRNPMRFAEVDAAIASLVQAALRSQASSPAGMPVFSMPVFQMPVFQMPVFAMPVF